MTMRLVDCLGIKRDLTLSPRIQTDVLVLFQHLQNLLSSCRPVRELCDIVD